MGLKTQHWYRAARYHKSYLFPPNESSDHTGRTSSSHTVRPTLDSALWNTIFSSSDTSETILEAGSFNFSIRFLATTSKASPGVKRPTLTPLSNQK